MITLNVQTKQGQTFNCTPAKIKAIIQKYTKDQLTGEFTEKDLTDETIRYLEDNYIDGATISESDINECIQLVLFDHNLPWVVRSMLEEGKQRIIDQIASKDGVELERYFSEEGVHPYEKITWAKQDATIKDIDGSIVFEQTGIEVPEDWSQTAINIVAQKYFAGKVGTPQRESSIKQIVDRVAKTYAKWGKQGRYFATEKQATIFEEELTHLLVNQYAAFNSPVWFNVGVPDRKPQCSACFINSVEDSMRSILELCTTEGMIFKGGSGAGINLSTLRSSHEHLGGSNGKSSGILSFMKGLDSFAGAIKSGGKTRRAAKMVILNIDHPDIEDFINCKAREEKKAHALIAHGFDGSFNGESYQSIQYQNANNSVRVNDDYMKALENDEMWSTKAVTTGEEVQNHKASELMDKITKAAWECGDPGIQYDTTINKWHTCPNSGKINGSNPCSEYMFLDNTACNLASLNLMKFMNKDKSFDYMSFKKAVKVLITAMEISVDFSTYPTSAITRKSYDFRTLGLGYANLGSLLMSQGLPYDSEQGRNLAACITSIMTAASYEQSAEIARIKSPFYYYEKNKAPMLKVMRMHQDAAKNIPDTIKEKDLHKASIDSWNNAIEKGEKYGYRNAQTTVLAPTGTIGFLMDCDTTGIEPAIVLVAYKFLAGGGMIKLVNNTVNEALHHLGYTPDQITRIVDYIDKHDTIEGAPELKESDLPVFDCAFKPANGERYIKAKGHIRMMAAVQPFLSGAISKTVNMPEDSTPEEIKDIYVYGWQKGLKAIAIYRDGCKKVQPIKTSTKEESAEEINQEAPKQIQETAVHSPEDKEHKHPSLPAERISITHRFRIDQHKGWITVGMYENGMPGEIFVTMAKEGSALSGMMDSFATAVSIALQYGVPLEDLAKKFLHTRFEPSGFTDNPNIRIAKSIVDYIFRWLGDKFLDEQIKQELGLRIDNKRPSLQVSEVMGKVQYSNQNTATESELAEESQQSSEIHSATEVKANDISKLTATFENSADAPACPTCSSLTIRNGTCYKCPNCGETTGCS